MLIIVIAIIYIIYKLTKESLDTENLRQQAAKSGCNIYFDSFGRERNVTTGKINQLDYSDISSEKIFGKK